MAVVHDLVAGLGVSREPDALVFHFPGGVSGLRFAKAPGRIAASLVFAGSRMHADVSFQPGAVIREIDLSAREQAVDPNRWRLAILAALREWTGELEWCAQQPAALLSAVAALTHPLLAQVFQRGNAAIGEIPRWAVPTLRCPDPASAALTLTGEPNRRLVRALAASLVALPAPAPVELRPLGLAVMGAGMLSADELANVLEVPPGDRPLRLPSGEEVSEVRRALELFTPQRRARLMVNVARRHDAVELAATMQQLWWVRTRAEHPLPAQLDDLHEMCGRLVPVLAPRAEPDIIAHAEPPPEALDRRARRRVAEPRPAPATAPAPTLTRWPIQRELQRLHGYQRDGLHFVVPTSVAELKSWGNRLSTCVGDYGPAITARASWVIGVEQDEVLIGCVDMVPSSRRVRQALGRRNERLPDSILDSVVVSLAQCGLAPMPA